MATKPVCLVCEVEMMPGFMADFGHNNSANLPRWCPGQPTETFFKIGEVPYTQFKAGYSVVAYRCPECEALRLYAPSPETPEH